MTDNKQTQEYSLTWSRWRNDFPVEGFSISRPDGKMIVSFNTSAHALVCHRKNELFNPAIHLTNEEVEETGNFILEAFNTKALTGKGPKELWEERNKFEKLSSIFKGYISWVRPKKKQLEEQNKQLSERVKELQTENEALKSNLLFATNTGLELGERVKELEAERAQAIITLNEANRISTETLEKLKEISETLNK